VPGNPQAKPRGTTSTKVAKARLADLSQGVFLPEAAQIVRKG